MAAELTAIVDPKSTGRRVGAPGASVDAAGEIERLYLAHKGSPICHHRFATDP